MLLGKSQRSVIVSVGLISHGSKIALGYGLSQTAFIPAESAPKTSNELLVTNQASWRDEPDCLRKWLYTPGLGLNDLISSTLMTPWKYFRI